MRATPRGDELATRLMASRGLAIVALCGLLAAPAQALSQSATESSACENARSTAAMRECEIDRLKRADAGMNAAYKNLGAKLDQRGREKLRSAQEAWLKFRAAEADYQADAARDGTLAPLIAASVQADLTESRRKELEKAVREFK
jgi:uncharacterized protein YecT (DUF1311 family)